MRSIGWRSSLICLSVLTSIVACSGPEETQDVPSPYMGLWADYNALINYRTNKERTQEFCRLVYANYEKQGRDGYYLNPYLIQSSGEVFTYNSTDITNMEIFRERHYQGVVTNAGMFSLAVVETENSTDRPPSIILDDSQFVLSPSQATLDIFNAQKNLKYARTTPEEMDEYLAKRTTCMEARPVQQASQEATAEQEEPTLEDDAWLPPLPNEDDN